MFTADQRKADVFRDWPPRRKVCVSYFEVIKLEASYGSSNNLGHNILELYNLLVQIRLTTSKTKRDS